MVKNDSSPLVGVIMGSKSDWETMRHTDQVLNDFEVPHECLVSSAHRTPVETAEWAQQAEARGMKVIIAAAGGAAHLAGVVAAYTTVPVLGVPIESQSLKGLDSLLSMVQMPGGIPVGTLAIAILATSDPALREKIKAFRTVQAAKVKQDTLP